MKKKGFSNMPLVPICPMWPLSPCCNKVVVAQRPKMVLGHNLHHMAPCSILEAGLCVAFRPASFWFWAPGVHFGTSEPKFGPGIWKLGPGWPREVWGPKIGARKTRFCLGMVSKLAGMGFPATQMDCMVPRRPLGELVSPQTLPKMFTPTFPYFGEFGEGPLSPLCIPYGPRVVQDFVPQPSLRVL